MPSDETRQRLLDVATAVFAERGYQESTTRLICEKARANAAAVNYYFRDKLGLYAAVLGKALGEDRVAIAEQSLLDKPAEAALHDFVALMFHNLFAVTATDQYVKLMAHELAQPTEALAVVVERIIRPRSRLLCQIVARIIGSTPDSRTTRMGAHSVIGQIMHHMHARPVVQLLWPDWRPEADGYRAVIEHVVRFSLCGLTAMAAGSRDTAGRGLKGSAPRSAALKKARRR